MRLFAPAPLLIFTVFAFLLSTTRGVDASIGIECRQDHLFYTLGWKWKHNRGQSEQSTTDKDGESARLLPQSPRQPPSPSGSDLRRVRLAEQVDSVDQLNMIIAKPLLGQESIAYNNEMIKLTLFRFRPLRSLLAFRRWAGVKIMIIRDSRSSHSGSQPQNRRFELHDRDARSFGHLQRWGVLQELEAAEQRMTLVWKMGKRRALRFPGLPQCANMGIWYAYTVFFPKVSISQIVVHPVSWWQRYPVKHHEFLLTLNGHGSSSKSLGRKSIAKDADQDKVVFTSLFEYRNERTGLQPVTVGGIDSWMGRKIIEFLEEPKLNTFLLGYGLSSSLRLGFHQYRPIGSSITAVRVKPICKVDLVEALIIEDNSLIRYDITNRDQFIRSFSVDYNPPRFGEKTLELYEESYFHPLYADKRWVDSRIDLSQNIGRMYSYSLWFKVKDGEAKNCFFEIVSLDSQKNEVHAVYSNTFDLVKSMPGTLRKPVFPARPQSAYYDRQKEQQGMEQQETPNGVHPRCGDNQAAQNLVFASNGLETGGEVATEDHPPNDGDDVDNNDGSGRNEIREVLGFVAKNAIIIGFAAACVAARALTAPISQSLGGSKTK